MEFHPRNLIKEAAMKYSLKIKGAKYSKPSKLKVGSIVKSDYHIDEKDVVRRITEIYKDETCGSGFRASAESFKCGHCGRPYGQYIEGVDSTWFIPVNKEDFINKMYEAIANDTKETPRL